MDELVSIVTEGVPVNAVVTGVDLERASHYDNHSSVSEHLPSTWNKIGEDVRRQNCFVILKSAAHEIPNLEFSPSAIVVTHKVRTMDNSSFDARTKKKKGGLTQNTDPNTVTQSLCVLPLPTFLVELVSLRKSSRKRKY